MAEEPYSEFGRGLVICLVKFAEHFERNDLNGLYQIEDSHRRGKEMTKEQLLELNAFYATNSGSHEERMSYAIEMWANAATDHLREIQTPEGKSWDEIRKQVSALQSLGLEIGHGSHKEVWKLDVVKTLKTMTREIAFLIDEKIGLDPCLGSF
jgi:hypothetical protein